MSKENLIFISALFGIVAFWFYLVDPDLPADNPVKWEVNSSLGQYTNEELKQYLYANPHFVATCVATNDEIGLVTGEVTRITDVDTLNMNTTKGMRYANLSDCVFGDTVL